MDQKIYSSNKQNHQSGKHNHDCSTGCFNCWSISGRLYPKNQLDDIKNIVTNLESSKTLYTKCDYYLERCVHEVILKLEDQFKEYNTLMENELQLQNKLLNDLWMNTQKYLILTR